jgi:hypothetical protein
LTDLVLVFFRVQEGLDKELREGEKKNNGGTYGEGSILVDVGEGFDHVGNGEGFRAVPVHHAMCDGESGYISLERMTIA